MMELQDDQAIMSFSRDLSLDKNIVLLDGKVYLDLQGDKTETYFIPDEQVHLRKNKIVAYKVAVEDKTVDNIDRVYSEKQNPVEYYNTKSPARTDFLEKRVNAEMYEWFTGEKIKEEKKTYPNKFKTRDNPSTKDKAFGGLMEMLENFFPGAKFTELTPGVYGGDLTPNEPIKDIGKLEELLGPNNGQAIIQNFMTEVGEYVNLNPNLTQEEFEVMTEELRKRHNLDQVGNNIQLKFPGPNKTYYFNSKPSDWDEDEIN